MRLNLENKGTSMILPKLEAHVRLESQNAPFLCYVLKVQAHVRLNLQKERIKKRVLKK